MSKPDVSVVMSVFNSAPTLPATLDSVSELKRASTSNSSPLTTAPPMRAVKSS